MTTSTSSPLTAAAAEPEAERRTFDRAYEALRPEIEGLSQKEFLTLNVDIEEVVTRVMGAYQRLSTLRDQAARMSFDPSWFDRLDLTAGALGHAHIRVHIASKPGIDIEPMVDELTRVRKILASDLEIMVLRGLLEAELIERVRMTGSVMKLAWGVMALADRYETSWKTVSARTTMTMEELNQAREAADKLIRAMGTNEAQRRTLPDVLKNRIAAFTLFYRAYDQVRKVVTYLRWEAGDAEDFVPSLFVKRRKKKAKPTQASEETSPPIEPARLPMPEVVLDGELVANEIAHAALPPASPPTPAGVASSGPAVSPRAHPKKRRKRRMRRVASAGDGSA